MLENANTARFALAAGFMLAWVAHALHAQSLPDAPEPRARTPLAADAPRRYVDALATWRTPEEIARYADATFVYDRSRALALAEQPDARATRPAIHTPEAMFDKPQGVCVDLARFGVETLNRIDPSYAARYVMIEFEPVIVEGRSLRRHWVATFRRDGMLWVFADSRRPGYVAGPYPSLDAFIADYARYRNQPIVAFRGTDSYLKASRTLARSPATGKSP